MRWARRFKRATSYLDLWSGVESFFNRWTRRERESWKCQYKDQEIRETGISWHSQLENESECVIFN